MAALRGRGLTFSKIGSRTGCSKRSARRLARAIGQRGALVNGAALLHELLRDNYARIRSVENIEAHSRSTAVSRRQTKA